MRSIAAAIATAIACSSGAPPSQPKPAPGAAPSSDEPAPITPEAPDSGAASAPGKPPAVVGASSYTAMVDRTVTLAINVWVGWAPIIAANGGFKPGVEWATPSGKSFKVELKLIDNPIAMRDALAAGRIHAGWASVDMLPLLVVGLSKDSRTMPRVFQQIDWSNGGDGIVGRASLASLADLRGRSVVLAESSPSQYYGLHALLTAGIQPSEVQLKYTRDGFQAAAAFNNDKSIDAMVGWAPDIYTLAGQRRNKMVATTDIANKLVARVWFARADFARDHPDIIEGLVRGIFDAHEQLATPAGRQRVARLIGDGFAVRADEVLGILDDAHLTNAAANRAFLLEPTNPFGFRATYQRAHQLYRLIGSVEHDVDADQIADPSVLARLLRVPTYRGQRDNYPARVAPGDPVAVPGSDQIGLRYTVHFAPSSAAFDAPQVLDAIARQAESLGAARILVDGHTDDSMRGKAPAAMVDKLATERAEAVRAAIRAKIPTLADRQVRAAGHGFRKPADRDNRARNRRVEILIYKAEPE